MKPIAPAMIENISSRWRISGDGKWSGFAFVSRNGIDTRSIGTQDINIAYRESVREFEASAPV